MTDRQRAGVPGEEQESARRWRLVLGRYAEPTIPIALEGGDRTLDQALAYLYDREYRSRGHRHEPGQGGSLDPSAPTALNWLNTARELFPRSTFERMQVQAIERYGLTELLADEVTAQTLTPSRELATALMSIRGKLDRSVEAGVRMVISRVVAEIVAVVRPRFTAALSGRRDRSRQSPQRISQNFDWRRTIAANLKNRGPDGRLVISEVKFNARVRRTVPWDVILCVDQSASMASSVLFSAVCASVLAALPGVNCSLILFDTNVVDMSHLAADPVEVLMTAQLGGGTDIARALGYCETLVRRPARTVVAVISDFEEGGSVSALLATVGRMVEAGVTLLGIAALDENADPVHDPEVGARLAARGMSVAALTPEHFAEWLGEVMR
ncbi:VWA domain-containing protein [Nakamurella silvestris]|nr:VWA domain-containing protein [Nakamurella silvestris]